MKEESGVLRATWGWEGPHGIKWMVQPQEKKKQVPHRCKMISFRSHRPEFRIPALFLAGHVPYSEPQPPLVQNGDKGSPLMGLPQGLKEVTFIMT